MFTTHISVRKDNGLSWRPSFCYFRVDQPYWPYKIRRPVISGWLSYFILEIIVWDRTVSSGIAEPHELPHKVLQSLQILRLTAQSFLGLNLPRLLTDIAIFNVGKATYRRNQDLALQCSKIFNEIRNISSNSNRSYNCYAKHFCFVKVIFSPLFSNKEHTISFKGI